MKFFKGFLKKKKPAYTTSLTDMPEEIINHILRFTINCQPGTSYMSNSRALRKLAQTNKMLNSYTKKTILWRRIALAAFPQNAPAIAVIQKGSIVRHKLMSYTYQKKVEIQNQHIQKLHPDDVFMYCVAWHGFLLGHIDDKYKILNRITANKPLKYTAIALTPVLLLGAMAGALVGGAAGLCVAPVATAGAGEIIYRTAHRIKKHKHLKEFSIDPSVVDLQKYTPTW